MDYEKFEKNISILINLFDRRPNHLAKYLIDNNCFTDEFINMVLNSEKLNKMDIESIDYNSVNFHNIEEMNLFYDNLISIQDEKIDNKTIDNLHKTLNDKLFDLISKEEYEESAKLRDYMIRKNIKIII